MLGWSLETWQGFETGAHAAKGRMAHMPFLMGRPEWPWFLLGDACPEVGPVQANGGGKSERLLKIS